MALPPRRRKFLALTAVACGHVSGCSRPAPTWERAIAMGRYDVGPPTCASSGAAPNYPSANYAATLYAFDALTEHSLTVSQNQTLEVMRDVDCSLSVARTLFQNFDGEFTQRVGRKYSFEPPGCTLGVNFRGYVYPVGPEYTALFTDSSEVEPDVPFSVAKTATGYSLATVDRYGYADVWAAFGCAAHDAIEFDINN